MERQLGTTLEEIRRDHVERYRFAAKQLAGRVLDAACGIGYGSKILHDAGCEVIGMDIDAEAIATAREHYPGPKYDQLDLRWNVEYKQFDSVVSFETLEHLQNPVLTLGRFAQCLQPGGLLICSVPNERLYPFIAENFANDEYPHLRHYTPGEFDDLLNAGGFYVDSHHCQKTKYSAVEPGTEGIFLVYVCRRR